MRYDVTNRFTGAVQFTADIDCADSDRASVKLGFAVIWAVKTDANLSDANLSGAYLNGADLSDANLSGANLSGANLSGAYLSDANLNGANLSGAYLRCAYLNGADLHGADLHGADLSGVHGINDYAKCIQIDTYPITYTAEIIQIGCQRHTHQEWAAFTDTQIRQMDGSKAIAWWRKYKDWLFQTIEMCPAEPTQKKGK